MARSATDATRFTATHPVAHSRPTTIDIAHLAGPAPPGETPQQKVVRLREAARRARSQPETGAERLVRRGRTWADRAHRVTVMGLVGLSVIGGGLAVYSLVDMWIYNAGKKREFMAEQTVNYQLALARAVDAEARGRLTPDLALVLNKERAVQQYEAEQAERSKRSVFEKTTDWVMGNAPKVEKPGGVMGFAPREIQRIAEDLGVRNEEAPPAAGAIAAPRPDRVAKEAAAVVGGAVPAGGMLDRMAERASADVQQASRGWFDWLSRR